MIQSYTSKNTSVNTTKLPYIYNHLDFEKMKETFKKIMVFDYGCGKEVSHIRAFLAEKGIIYFGYDPYWGPVTDIKLFEKIITESYAQKLMPIVVCSNVLNVINDWDEVRRIKESILSYLVPYYFKIHEGDKTGVGKISKRDCWQWNKPTKEYKTNKFEVIKKKILTYSLYSRFII